MNKHLEEIFQGYDFGFDLDFVSAEDWTKTDGHYVRKVYLQEVERFTQPITAYFHVYTAKNKKDDKIVVQMH